MGDFLVRGASLHVPYHGFPLLLVENLPEKYSLQLPLVCGYVVVIEVCGYFQSGVAQRIEWQHGDIKVQEVWVVAVDDIKCAVVEVVDKLLAWCGGSVAPSPLRAAYVVRPASLAEGMVLPVQVLWVISLPPFTLAVSLCQMSVIGFSDTVALEVVSA